MSRLDSRGQLNAKANLASQSIQNTFSKVVAFVEREGHCRIPVHYKEDPKLGNWVVARRKEKRKGLLRKDRIMQLHNVGFVWDVNERKKK